MLTYWYAAQVVTAVHLAFASFMFLGWWVIVVGALAKARVARHRVFRLTHLGGFLIVLIFALAGRPCPLTDVEFWLLKHSGTLAADPGPFLTRVISATLYPDISPVLLFWLALFFGLSTVLLWWLVRPRAEEH